MYMHQYPCVSSTLIPKYIPTHYTWVIAYVHQRGHIHMYNISICIRADVHTPVFISDLQMKLVHIRTITNTEFIFIHDAYLHVCIHQYPFHISKSCILCTGQRSPIGCLKLQVIFRKRATSYRALLRKITCKDKASYGCSLHCRGIGPQQCGM